MENINTANSQTIRTKPILVHCLTDSDFSLSSDKFQKTNEFIDADIFLSRDDKKVNIHIPRLGQFYKTSHNNLDFILSRIAIILKEETTFTPHTSLKQLSSWNKTSKFFYQISVAALNSLSLDEFIDQFFHIDFLKEFQSVHILIHEKGTLKVSHSEYEQSKKREHHVLLNDFSELYNAIRKSKNRSFGQESLKASNFNIIGTCIGHEFSLPQFNIIFLLSKNDFLPQQEEDISFFNSILPSIEYKINSFLSARYHQRYIEMAEDALTYLPINDFKSGNISPSFLAYYAKNNAHLRVDYTIDIKHKERVSLLGDLLNTLKHELSNPLFGLRLSTELLLLEDFSEDDLFLIQEMHKAVERCHKILENFSHLYNEKDEFETVDLLQLLKEIFVLTKSESKSIAREIYFNAQQIELDKLTSKLNLLTNKTWMAQIFFNLIINSAQALNDYKVSSPLIKVSFKTSALNNLLEIHFSDNGPGFSRESKDKVLEPFFTTKTNGTGLGLSIASSLLTKMSGSIQILDSDKGAHFLLSLPYENINH